MTHTRRPWLALAAVLVSGAAGAGAPASYPVKPVRVLVASGTGGGLDFVARLVAPPLSAALGHGVIIDNRPGAGGDIAVETAARAAPDGYTLVMLSASTVVRAALYRTRYDLFKDFAPVTELTAGPYALVVHPGVPAATVAELIQQARAQPGRLHYASTGNGTLTHLAGELFNATAGVRLVHVPYKGIGALLPDLLAGQVQATYASLAPILPQVRSGRLRALGVTAERRTSAAPELPTLIEAGLAGFTVTQWHGLLAPGGTARQLVERLQREVAAVLERADVLARLTQDGTDVVASAPEAFAAHLAREHARWSEVIRSANVRAE